MLQALPTVDLLPKSIELWAEDNGVGPPDTLMIAAQVRQEGGYSTVLYRRH